jgi:hypothetical protein
MRYGESYFDPDTGWHPRPTQVFWTSEGWDLVSAHGAVSHIKLSELDNLHRLKDGVVELCSSLN